jgi:hypothetical protein
VVTPEGRRSVRRDRPAPDPPIDCFYVYPTVSRDRGLNADLSVGPEERAAAITQAARFSSVCRVWAPIYPQLTTDALRGTYGPVTVAAAHTAYAGLLSAWEDYLTHDNEGRGVVLIGHSQGAFLLDALIRRVVDRQALQRRLLVSTLLLGGQVEVPLGRAVGGDFQNVPACTAPTQVGCVVAYSTFEGEPPPDAVFARGDTSIGALLGLVPRPGRGMRVLCTNPAALDGASAPLDTYLPTRPPSACSERRRVCRWPSRPGSSSPVATRPGARSATVPAGSTSRRGHRMRAHACAPTSGPGGDCTSTT